MIRATTKALIRLAPGAKVIALPLCARCAKVAPECRCGMSAARK